MSYKPKYGLTTTDIERLRCRYRALRLEEGFGSLDKFLRFASESGYEPGMVLHRRNPREPHSEDNSVFCASVNREKYKNINCSNCEEAMCTDPGRGCSAYRRAWIENWNKHIYFKKSEQPVDRNVTRFRYEHPDLEREGITFNGNP